LSEYEYSHGGNAIFEGGFDSPVALADGGAAGSTTDATLIDLSANINPLGIPVGVREAIIAAIPRCDQYPDSFSRQMCRAIGRFEGLDAQWVFCGNGASDIIFRLPRATAAKKVLLSAPTFSDYERAAASFGATVIRHRLDPATGFAVDASFVQAAWDNRPEMVFVCNPNNPTGRLTERSIIAALLEYCAAFGSWLVVDECFLDFTAPAASYTSKPFLAGHSQLVVLKALTKIFALPGIRLGYALSASQELIQGLYFHGADWPLSNLAQAAGCAALNTAETSGYLQDTISLVAAERVKMEQQLGQLGFRMFPASANYVFLRSPFTFDLATELNRRGIRIRRCANYHGLDSSYFRIAVAAPELNDRLLSAVQEVVTDNHGGTLGRPQAAATAQSSSQPPNHPQDLMEAPN